ncbi:MAG: nucleotidyltransferase family protein [Clostridia bacterium]
MQAVILAGGFGSRLRPLTDNLPKPMMPIINKPILEYIIAHLRRNGIVEIAMTLGYKAEIIENYFGDGEKFGVNLTYFKEDTPLGTAGCVKNAQSFLTEDFLVISGDAFTNIDIKALTDFHYSRNSTLTLATKSLSDARGFGLVQCDESGKITSFREKPAEKISGLVNMGIYVVSLAVLQDIPLAKFDFAKDLFPLLLGKLYSFQTSCFWSDIGTLSSYYSTNGYVARFPQRFGLVF